MAGVQRRPWGEPARIPDQVVRHLGAGGAGAYPVDYAIASPCRSTRAGAPEPHAGPGCLLLHLPALMGLGVLGKRLVAGLAVGRRGAAPIGREAGWDRGGQVV